MAEIYTKRGDCILLDQEDCDYICDDLWHLNGQGYPETTFPHPFIGGKNVKIALHRWLMGLQVGDKRNVDHINGNRLDNRRCNLRICSSMQNNWNKGMHPRNTSGYKGVSWLKRRGKWISRIEVEGKEIYLGLFDDKEDAAKAYQDAAIKLHGQYANLSLVAPSAKQAEESVSI